MAKATAKTPAKKPPPDHGFESSFATLEQLRYTIEKVCDRHGVTYHPTRGVGAAREFIRDLLDGVTALQLNAIKEAVDAALGEAPDPDEDALRQLIAEQFESETDVVVRDAPDGEAELAAEIQRGNCHAVTRCPLCGAPALPEVVAFGGPEALVVEIECSDMGKHGGCKMPRVDRLTWERFPRSNVLTTTALKNMVHGVVGAWSGDVYAQDPRDKYLEQIAENVAAVIELPR